MENTDATQKRGRGRPEGSTNKFSVKSREWAESTGELPHEFLLRVARGEVVKHKVKNPLSGLYEDEDYVPKWEDRMDAAKSAAPYFAPKFATVELIQKVSDDELDEIIKILAAETGLTDGLGGEGQEIQSTGTEEPTKRRRLSRPA